jgi:hypothetical protein
VGAGCDLSDVVRGVPIAVCESKRLEPGIDRNADGAPARSSLPAIIGRSKDISWFTMLCSVQYLPRR